MDIQAVELGCAADEGRLVDVTRLVEIDGVDPNYGSGRALCYAAANGHTHVAAYLLTKKVSPTFCDRDGFTPLVYAVVGNYPDILRLLLDNADVDVEATTYKQQSLLHVALDKKHNVVAQLLRDHLRRQSQAKVAAALQDGRISDAKTILSQDTIDASLFDDTYRPLAHRVAEMGHVELLQRVLEKPNLNVDATDNHGHTALASIAIQDTGSVVRALVNANARLDLLGESSVVQHDGFGALLLDAASSNKVHDVTQLLRAGVSPTSTNNNGETVLHVAAASGSAAVVQQLLEKDASLARRRDAQGNLPLHGAVTSGHAAIVETLLKTATHCDLTSTNHNGLTPLAVAVQGGHAAMVARLLKAQASLGPMPHEGWSLLHKAAFAGQHDVIKVLIQNNFNIFATTAAGETPLALAIQQQHSHTVLQTLRKAEADEKQRFLAAVRAGVDDDVQNFLAKGVGVNTTDATTGLSALRLAVAAKATRVVERLWCAGATVDATEGTALVSLAAQSGHADMVKLLLTKLGPDTTASAIETGYTEIIDGGHAEVAGVLLSYLQQSVASADHVKMLTFLAAAAGQVEVLQRLLAGDPKRVTDTTDRGRTLLMVAAASNNVEIVAMLLSLLAPVSEANEATYGSLKARHIVLHAALAHFMAPNEDHKTAVQLATSTTVKARLESCTKGTQAMLKSVDSQITAKEAAMADAMRAGHWTAVTSLLQEGVAADDVHKVVDHGVATGDADLLLALLGGVTDETRHQVYLTVLTAAVAKNKAQLVLRLLHMSHSNMTLDLSSLLHACVETDQPMLLTLLLASPWANINATNQEGYTALALSVHRNRSSMVQLLLSLGADASIPLPSTNGAGMSLLHVATQGLPETRAIRDALLAAFGIVLDDADPESTNKALLRAVMDGHESAVRCLLDMTVDVWTMQPEQNNMTLLAVAIQRGHNAVAQVLYPRMYPPPALVQATDLRVGMAIFGGPNVTVYTASYHGKDVVLKGPKFPNKRMMVEFEREVDAMQTATSPYLMPLVGILDNQSTAPHTFKPRGQLYSPTMVMEYMDLGDLHDYIQSKKHKVQVGLELATIDVALVLALALADLHARGVIHRDVKSLNIFLSTTYYVRLGDLGSARTLDTDSVMSSNVGTKYWMAPEVLRVPGHAGEGRAYTTAADIYSFGVVLTELDTLSEPFSDIPAANRGAIEEAVRLGKLRPKMSATCQPWLQDLADKCLSFDPTARPTAAAIVDELPLRRKTEVNASTSAGRVPTQVPDSSHNGSEAA